VKKEKREKGGHDFAYTRKGEKSEARVRCEEPGRKGRIALCVRKGERTP